MLESTLLKKRPWHRCFPVNFAKFPRTPFFTEHLRWLLLCSETLISFCIPFLILLFFIFSVFTLNLEVNLQNIVLIVFFRYLQYFLGIFIFKTFRVNICQCIAQNWLGPKMEIQCYLRPRFSHSSNFNGEQLALNLVDKIVLKVNIKGIRTMCEVCSESSTVMKSFIWFL